MPTQTQAQPSPVTSSAVQPVAPPEPDNDFDDLAETGHRELRASNGTELVRCGLLPVLRSRSQFAFTVTYP